MFLIDDFIRIFAQDQPYAQVNPQIFFLDPDIEYLFESLKKHGTSILPYINENHTTDVWMIVGNDRKKIDFLMQMISRFVIPSYAVFSTSVPQFLLFNKDNELNKIGKQVFVGYYRMDSLPIERPNILTQLNRCLQLIQESVISAPISTRVSTYRELHDAFRLALLASDWNEAENIIEMIDVNNLTTAENLQFLRIEWLARQERWADIWQYPSYDLLAKIPLPQSVRSALLIAFHYTQLLHHENDENWKHVFDILKVGRPKLALLLNGRFGLQQPGVLRIFAYIAVIDEDRDSFERIELDTPQNDYQTRLLLNTIKQYLPEPTSYPEIDLIPKIELALNNSDYEGAWHLVDQVEDRIIAIATKLQISYLSKDVTLTMYALQDYDRLYVENKREISTRYPEVQQWLTNIKALHGIHQSDTMIPSWAIWFSRATANNNDTQLPPAIDYLADSIQQTFWTTQHIEALVSNLASVTNQQYINHKIFRLAIHKLVDLCLNDEEFPRSGEYFAELYDYLLQFILQDTVNAINTSYILRLQEALLVQNPATLPDAISMFQKWFNTPKPVYQSNILEALELLILYGAESSKLQKWCRDWLESALNTPDIIISELRVWYSFREWLFVGKDLLSKLESRIETSSNTLEDPLLQLPDKYQIAIFSFDEKASARARDILLERNSTLDVRISSEKHNNKTVENLAKNADLVVLVTTCISHAISYAVTPHARKLIYPKSRGASSILRAIDDHLTV